MSLLLLFHARGVIPNVIDTVHYSQHPVNCMLAGNEPMSNVKKRTMEWIVPDGRTKETSTATKTPTRQITLPPMRRLGRSGWH